MPADKTMTAWGIHKAIQFSGVVINKTPQLYQSF